VHHVRACVAARSSCRFAGNECDHLIFPPLLQRSFIAEHPLYTQALISGERVNRPVWAKESSMVSKDFPLVSGIHIARMITVNDDKDPNRK